MTWHVMSLRFHSGFTVHASMQQSILRYIKRLLRQRIVVFMTDALPHMLLYLAGIVLKTIILSITFSVLSITRCAQRLLKNTNQLRSTRRTKIMKKELLTRTECDILRGIAIIGIFLHNYCHWLRPVVQENEYQITSSINVDWF